MAKIRNGKRQSDYIAMNIKHLQECELSLAAKGLMSFLLSFSDESMCSMSDILEANKNDSHNDIIAAFRELECLGYATRSDSESPDFLFTIYEGRGE